MNLRNQQRRIIKKSIQKIFIKPGAAQIQYRIRKDGFLPVMMNRQQIKLQCLLNLGTKVKPCVGILIEIVDILSHTQEFTLIFLHPLNVVQVFNSLCFAEDIGCGEEIIANVPMRNVCFPNGFQMDGTDLVVIDLRKDLPIGNAKGFLLDLGAFRTIAKPLGRSGAAIVHGHEEAVSGIGRTGSIRAGMERLIERESRMFPDQGFSGKALKRISPLARKPKRERRKDGGVERPFLVKELKERRTVRSITAADMIAAKEAVEPDGGGSDEKEDAAVDERR